MAINTVDDVVSGLANKQRVTFLKAVTATPDAAGAYVSTWLAAGYPGAGSASPAYTSGSDYTCSSGTTGALVYSNAAVQNWLAHVSASSNTGGTLIIADRLWSCSTISGTVQTAQNIVNPGNLPARITDGGHGCELWIEHFVATGSATGSLTATYVNSDGVAGRTGTLPTVQSAAAAGRFQPVALQAGDKGIRQLTSISKSNTWTSGTFGATIIKRIAEIPLPLTGIGASFDWAQLGLPKIPNDACIMFIWCPNSATAPTFTGTMDIIDK